MSLLHRLPFWLWLLVMSNGLITANDAIQDNVISVLYWFSRSLQTLYTVFFLSCVSIYGTHLAQTLQYSSVATIDSNALKSVFSSIHSILVVIWRWADLDAFQFMMWQLCMALQNVLCLSHCFPCCSNVPPTASLCSHSHKRSRSVSGFHPLFSETTQGRKTDNPTFQVGEGECKTHQGPFLKISIRELFDSTLQLLWLSSGSWHLSLVRTSTPIFLIP